MLEQPELAFHPNFATNADRIVNRPSLHETIEGVFARLTLTQAVERLDGAQIANGEVRDVAEFWQHPQLTERGRVTTVESQAHSPLPALYPAAEIAGVTPRFDPIPAVGAHTAQILRELNGG